MEKFEEREMVKDQEWLKKSLLSGEISPEIFLKQIRALDQSTLSREEAIKNLQILENDEVKKNFEGEEKYSDYCNLLSLTHFHVAQIKIETNSPDVLFHLESALSLANESNISNSDEWKLYIEGTIAYLKNDQEALGVSFSKIPEGRSKTILGNFIIGLENRGNANYLEDYLK